jgi:two-component system response regulator MprA
MDGLTVLRRLRSVDPALPVLLLTARDTVGDRVTGLDLGADDYLTKPFDLDELLARLRSLLRRGALVAEAAAGRTRTRTCSPTRTCG